MRELIDIAKGFQTSVNIAYDLNNDEKVRGFIPTQSSLDVIEDVLLSTAVSSTQRARILIGAYGRGKSHIILVLMSMLFKKDKQLFDTLLAKIKANNPDLYEYANEFLQSNKKILPIIVRGSSSSLTQSFLNALQQALSDEGFSDLMPETHFRAAISAIENWKTNYQKTYDKFVKTIGQPISEFMLALQMYDVNAYEKFYALYPSLTSGSIFNPFIGFDIVELYETINAKLKGKGYDGIYIVYDEFSKYLEASIANATISDIKLLQDFAEKCDRSGERQMHLMLICHKDIANYIDGNLPKEKVDGWRGVSGRFKHMNLHNNYSQMYEIISAVVRKTEPDWSAFKAKHQAHFDDLKQRFAKNGLLDRHNPIEINNAVEGCYPLHPISTFILPRLSEKVAQNERTLFTFLSADDRHTLSAFLKMAEGEFPMLTPDYIYDYFEPLFRKEPYTSEVHKVYKLTASVLRKVEDLPFHSKIIKTIAVIYLVEQFEKLPPIVDMIVEAFRDTVDDVKIIHQALTDLIEKECIVYLKRSNNYLKIKDTSGVDIIAEIEGYTRQKLTNKKNTDILNESSFDSYMYPTAYNDEHEITRYFGFTFITSAEFFAVTDWNDYISGIKADGVVYAIIPVNQEEIAKICKKIEKQKDHNNRILFIVPKQFQPIDKMALEYEAVKNLKTEVVNDELLSDEYEIYIEDLSEVIGSFINNYARPENKAAFYYYNGKQLQIFRKAQLSGELSCICTEIFWRTPVINNESINKNELPTVAINSRSKILAGLLSNNLEPYIGLTGTGQDVSIMRSTLLQTGILEHIDTSPVINLKPQNEHIRYMLSEIQSFIKCADGKPRCLSELYDKLTSFDNGIGLKRGIIPIYIAAVLHLHKANLVILYKGNEVKITPDLLNEINATTESPSEYFIRIEDWNEDKARYMQRLEELFIDHISDREKSYNNFTYMLLAMNRWYMSLPKYAKEMTEEYAGDGKFKPLDRQRKKYISGLKQLDNNPREFLFEKVFRAFGMEEVSPNVVGMISETKTEFDNAIKFLISKLAADVKNIFASSKTGVSSSLASTIKDWYETLSEQTLRTLFSGNESRILELLKTVTNDESTFIQRLAKAVTALRIEDWSKSTITVFFRDLKAFKETVDECNRQKASDTVAESDSYEITFTDSDGNKKTKVFQKTSYTPPAKLLWNEIQTALEEHGQSITEQEKRQVLIEILEKLC